MDANVSLHKSNFFFESFTTPIGRAGTIVNLVFNPPIKANETRELKICYYIPKFAQKEDSLCFTTKFFR
ncbi:MAG: hypothetical protein QW563_05920 [Candidatus Methanomethylicia archaeon]